MSRLGGRGQKVVRFIEHSHIIGRISTGIRSYVRTGARATARCYYHRFLTTRTRVFRYRMRAVA